MLHKLKTMMNTSDWWSNFVESWYFYAYGNHPVIVNTTHRYTEEELIRDIDHSVKMADICVKRKQYTMAHNHYLVITKLRQKYYLLFREEHRRTYRY